MYLQDQLKMKQVHGKPMHPQTQGKIERYHRTMENVVKLNHFYHPEELTQALNEFVENYNNKRYHESLKNLTPPMFIMEDRIKYLKKRLLLNKKLLLKEGNCIIKKKY